MADGSGADGGAGSQEAAPEPSAPVMHRDMARSGAGRPRDRPAVDGPCGCGWGDALVRGSRIGRMLAGGRAKAKCGCSTAVIARATFRFDADPKASVSVLIRPAKMPDSSRLILEAVEPAGPWRLFIGATPSTQTMFGPYDKAGDTIALVTETVTLMRGTGMAVSIEGDFDRAMGTFSGSRTRVPTAAELTGK